MKSDSIRTVTVPGGMKMSIPVNTPDGYKIIGATEGHGDRVIVIPAKGLDGKGYINVHNKNSSPIFIELY